jgi:hypothetical protein
LTGHKVVSVRVFEGMEAAIQAATADAERAREEAGLAMAARDAIVASLTVNPMVVRPPAFEGNAAEVKLEGAGNPDNPAKGWRKK